MNFWEAWKAMKDGEKIRIDDWKNGDYWQIEEGMIIPYGDGCRWSAISHIDSRYIDATNWQIVPKEKELPRSENAVWSGNAYAKCPSCGYAQNVSKIDVYSKFDFGETGTERTKNLKTYCCACKKDFIVQDFEIPEEK